MSANIYGQLGGLAIGLAGNAIQNSQEKQDKGIANGQEDPALAALRKRMAAQDAQTAMSVAASQQGVNPALAQRNAQQALAQAQVRTNANLAAQNAQSTQQSRQANRGVQQRVVQGTMQGLAGAANLLGTQGAINDAGAANTLGSQGPVTQEEKNKFGGATSALSAPEGAAGPLGAGVAIQPQPTVATSTQDLAAPVPLGASPLGQMPAMQGGGAQLSQPAAQAPLRQAPAPTQISTPNGVPAGAVPVSAASPDQMVQAMSPQGLPVGSSPMGQIPAMQGGQAQLSQAPAQAPMRQASAPASAIPAQIDAPPPATLSPTESFSMLPVEVQEDPINQATFRSAESMRLRGYNQQADVLMEQLMARLGQ